MKNTVLKTVGASILAGFLAVSMGCTKTNPNAGGWDPDSAVIEGGVPAFTSTLDQPVDGNRSLVDPVYFAYDSSQVNPEEGIKCEQVASMIRQGQYKGVILEGHADERGSREYNMSLGERRADAVREYLVGLGVDYTHIQTRSFGEEQPADPGQTEAAYQKNRRVVFAIY
ncbi:MAG: OmpA family protein [Pontiellaceae bacterium]|nr:OmpA family protein [Pontiellaceae bacterium]